MSGRLRWGILGAGWIATRFAADLRYSDTGVFVRVASRDRARAATLADHHRAEVSDSYEALVAAPDVDAIYVATPTSLHRTHCLLALSHGKPVLCEKPFATSAAEAQEIGQAAQAAGVFCMEAMWTRFLPVMTELRRRVAEGALGEISQLSAGLGFPIEETEATAAITAPSLGGGALYDLGIYGVSIAHALFGPPETVDAMAIRSASDSIRDVAVTMRHGGARGPLLSSIRASHSTLLQNTLDVAGQKGHIHVEAPFIQATRARQIVAEAAGRDPEQPSLLKDVIRGTPVWPVARWFVHRARQHGFGRPYYGYGLWFQADEVARCIVAGRLESTIMPIGESVAVLTTMDRIRNGLEKTA